MLERPGSGSATLLLDYTVAPDYGRARVLSAGKVMVDLNGFSNEVAIRSVKVGEVELGTKPLQLVFTVFGKDDARG